MTALEQEIETKQKIDEDASVEVLHTKMPEHRKDAIMQRFKSGETQVLIATTIVEVGLHVPNASVLVVMDAHKYVAIFPLFVFSGSTKTTEHVVSQRDLSLSFAKHCSFGLGTLHQLRGRIARGNTPGQCYLLYDPKEERVELEDDGQGGNALSSDEDADEEPGISMSQVADHGKRHDECDEGDNGPDARRQRRDRKTDVARRMRMLQQNTSGFHVAEADLMAREPGQVVADGSALGAQSGSQTQSALSSLVSMSNVRIDPADSREP